LEAVLTIKWCADARTSMCVLKPLSPTDIRSVPSTSPPHVRVRPSSESSIELQKELFPNRADDREGGRERELIGILVASVRSRLLAAGHAGWVRRGRAKAEHGDDDLCGSKKRFILFSKHEKGLASKGAFLILPRCLN
jgi:hypothetical protein